MKEQVTQFLGRCILTQEVFKTHFAATKCVQISDFLAPKFAADLSAHLLKRNDWRHVINGASQIFETPADQLDAMPTAERALLEQAVLAAATNGFQFRYDTIRVEDAQPKRQTSRNLLDQFALSMNASSTINFLHDISGRTDFHFADVQATRYRAGDFLTRHDDNVEGKNRVLAYVLGLTRNWKAEWGGLLLFNDSREGVSRTIVPRFNTLTLFTVGQPHSVSYIAPYAGAPRISVTGWLRASGPN